MSSAAPEASVVASASGLLPEGPSLRWRRAAQGLRVMRLAMYAWLATQGLWTTAIISTQVTGSAAFRWTYVLVLYAIYPVAYVTFVIGLRRFGSVPASTGAASPARHSFICFASMPVLSLLGYLLSFALFALSDPALRTYSRLRFQWSPIVHLALFGACLWLLVRALGATLQSLGERPPAWAPKAVGAYIVWNLLMSSLSLARIAGVTVFSIWGLSRVMLPLSLASDCAIVLALAPVVGRTAKALARQESLESALR